jgi:hypothetical protein
MQSKEEVIKSLEQFRSDLKFMGDTINKDFERTREISLAVTAIQEAMMFTGNTIKEINQGVSPYVNSDNPLNTKIDPFYVSKKVDGFMLPENYSVYEYVQKIKFFRLRLEILQTRFSLVDFDCVPSFGIATVIYARLAVVRAKNWLGMELGRIRDAKV